jgi:hypothetical protein
MDKESDLFILSLVPKNYNITIYLAFTLDRNYK